MNGNDFYFDLHQDIVTRQGKTCPRCKKSLVFASRLEVINGRMYCGTCSKEVRSLNRKKAATLKQLGLAEAKANYDRVRKSDK